MSKDNRASVYFDRETLQFVGVDAAYKKQLRETYKGVDIDRELGKMGLWLNSSKGKDRKGTVNFILNWLNNASPSMPPLLDQHDTSNDSPLSSLFQDYLKDLWKKSEHILEFNTIPR